MYPKDGLSSVGVGEVDEEYFVESSLADELGWQGGNIVGSGDEKNGLGVVLHPGEQLSEHSFAESAIGFGSGMVYWKSAVYQGETSAACINLIAKKPEEMGRAIILPAMVEGYAVFALLAAILGMGFVTDKALKIIIR